MRALLFLIGVACIYSGWVNEVPFVVGSGLFFIPYSIWGGR